MSAEFSLAARTYPGLEEILAGELRLIGAQEVRIDRRVVLFRGDNAVLYRANLLLRSAIRIHRLLFEFDIANQDDLYRNIFDFDWRPFLGLRDTLAVDSDVYSSFFNHGKFAALRVKDAVVDQFRKHFKARPSVDVQNPSVKIHLHIADRHCRISLDSSGESLAHRGYRIQADKAPLNEALAAGLVLLSGWDTISSFVDPLCGAGTIAIEAAMIARNIPPSMRRREFGFFTWKDFDESLWMKIQKTARSEIRKESPVIISSDRSRKAVEMAAVNIESAGLTDLIDLRCESFEDMTPPETPGTLVMNPPYGERLEENDIFGLYELLGDTLKQKYSGWRAWILSANSGALKHVGLRPSKKIPIQNGPLDARFYLYEMYKGSREEK